MRTSLRTSGGMPGIPYYQGGFYPHKHRGGEKKEKSPAPKRGNNGFLTGRILPVVSPEVKLSTDQGEINVATAENYRHLLACAEHYAKLTGQLLKVKKGRNHSHSISLLYDALDTLIPQHLNIEEDEGKLHFLLFDYHKWDDYTFFWLPIRFAESLPPKLRRITLTFIHRFVRHHRLSSVTDMPFFDYVADYLMNLEDDGDLTTKQRRKIISCAESYTGGAICRKLQKVHEKGYYKNLSRTIANYHPVDKTEEELLAFIENGMDLIATGQPSILDYQYDPDQREEQDYPPMELERIVLLTYDTDDRVNEDMIDCANSELRESYALSPVTTCLLTTDLREPFQKDDYPERFCKWFTGFTSFINDNF